MRAGRSALVAAVLAGIAAVAAAVAGGKPSVAGLPLVARIVHVNVLGDRYAIEPGDRLYADGRVLLGPTGRPLGVAAFNCTVTGVGPRYAGTCTATLHL